MLPSRIFFQIWHKASTKSGKFSRPVHTVSDLVFEESEPFHPIAGKKPKYLTAKEAVEVITSSKFI